MANRNSNYYADRYYRDQGYNPPTSRGLQFSAYMPNYVGRPVEYIGQMMQHLNTVGDKAVEDMSNLELAVANIRDSVDPIYKDVIEFEKQKLLNEKDRIASADSVQAIQGLITKAGTNFLTSAGINTALGPV